VQPAPKYDRREGLSVAVLGSTYGLRELKALAEALALVAQRQRVQTRLVVIGGVDAGRVKRLCPPTVTLEAPGHLDEREGVARLRRSFLLYMSYPFARRGRVLRTTSFPTKLSTYVMAARPLLLHMPIATSVASLGATAPYATLWSSLSPEEGAGIMSALWLGHRASESFHAAADNAREQHFDLSRNSAALFGALNSLAGDATGDPINTVSHVADGTAGS
jgi:hypothetical protein